MKLFDLTGRVALVTGSSRGIGFALARGLCEAGATVVLNGRDAAVLARAEEALLSEGRTVRAFSFDVTDETAVEAAVAQIEEEVGPLDILVNNAGIQHRAPLEDFPADAFRRLMTVNVEAAFLCGRAAARRMIPRGRGKIVNVCSIQSELARYSIAPYTASKGALKNLTRGMATDWARHGLQVNGIGPGYFKTEMNAALVADPDFTAWVSKRTPAGRWGEVPELVGATVFLSSDASSYVNGHVIYVDGGMGVSL